MRYNIILESIVNFSHSDSKAFSSRKIRFDVFHCSLLFTTTIAYSVVVNSFHRRIKRPHLSYHVLGRSKYIVTRSRRRNYNPPSVVTNWDAIPAAGQSRTLVEVLYCTRFRYWEVLANTFRFRLTRRMRWEFVRVPSATSCRNVFDYY